MAKTERAWTLKVNSRGQVTLPAELRRELGIEPGDDLSWELVGDELYMYRTDHPDARARVQRRSQERESFVDPDATMSNEELMRLVRQMGHT